MTNRIQTSVAEQLPSEEQLKLTHQDLRNLIAACDEATNTWHRQKEELTQDYEPGNDEYADEEIKEVDDELETYAELKARLVEATKCCEMCGKKTPLYIESNLEVCDSCLDAPEAKLTS